MTTTRETETPPADEEYAPTIGTLLLRSAPTLRDQVAVQALVEEEHILARENVRNALVVKTDKGVMGCSWERFGNRLYVLGLPDEERAFVDLVLSIAGPHQTGLARVMELDDRRLAIVLRAMIQLAGSDALAVGTRI